MKKYLRKTDRYKVIKERTDRYREIKRKRFNGDAPG